MIRPFFKFLMLAAISSSAMAEQHCLEKRYVFDIGSGSTKSKAYLVDVCQNQLVQTLGEINKHVKYQQCISNSADRQTITKKCLKEGLEAIKAIEKEYGISCAKEKCAGIATAWARNAKNSQDLLDIFKQEDIHIELISQKEEGELGFKTALHDPSLKGAKPDDILAWDIGGGSFQLAGISDDGVLYIHEGPWGIFNFFQDLTENFPSLGLDVNNKRYFRKAELKEILQYASDRAGSTILLDKRMKDKIKHSRVIGLGRIMYMGIKYELELTNPLTKQKVKELIYEFADISVKEGQKKYPRLPDHFAPLIQEALILVYGIMNGAGIEQIEIVDSTLTDHVVLDEDYWGKSNAIKVAQQSFERQ